MTEAVLPLEFQIDQSELGPVLIGAEAIAERVKALGAAIDRDYKGQAVQMVVALDGAWIFASDLVRSMHSDVIVNFVSTSSYGNRKVSKGRVRVAGRSSFELGRDKKVIVVEDIVDTGRTAQTLISLLTRAGATSIRLASLLSKPARRRIDVPIDYLGFEIPNEFVVGYGMDFCEAYRNLPDIHVLR